MEKLNNKNSGFTLIELMIVVVIVAILGSAAIPIYREYLERGRASVVQGDLTIVAGRMQNYRQAAMNFTGANPGGVGGASESTEWFVITRVGDDPRSFLLKATPIAASEAKDDETFWYSSNGPNCIGAAYSPTCTDTW